MKSQKEVEADVRSWGFSTVYTWSDGPNACEFHFSTPRLITTRPLFSPYTGLLHNVVSLSPVEHR